MASISPDPARFQAFIQATDDDTTIVMINLLRYRDQAEYPSSTDEPGRTGREAYQHYASLAQGPLAAVGAKPIFMGSVKACLTAPGDEEWDDALLVQYPSKQAFLQMIASPEYQAIALHRTAALADSRLIATVASAAPAH